MVLLSAVTKFIGLSSTTIPSSVNVVRRLKGMITDEILRDICLLLPISTVVGLLTKRMIIKRNHNSILSLFVVGLIGDVLLEIWIDPFCQMNTSTFLTIPQSLATISWIHSIASAWGLRVLSSSEKSTTYTLSTSLIVLRLLFMMIGTYIGQKFIPIALTGSIATGKSTVAKMLIEVDDDNDDDTVPFTIIDTDSIGHQILLSPQVLFERTEANDPNTIVTPSDSVFPDIIKEFGVGDNKNILDDKNDEMIDRRKLGAIIFQDPNKRRILNRITHPRIIQVMLKQILTKIYDFNNFFNNKKSIICADVPLLYESGKLSWLFTLTILVACTSEQQYTRLRTRNTDLTEQQCRDRIASQISIDKKIKMSDIVIMNDGSIDDLKKAVEKAKNDTIERLYSGFTVFQYLIIIGGISLSKIFL